MIRYALLVLAAALPLSAQKPNPSRTSFQLATAGLGAITINRVNYGVATTGEIGVDSTDSSVIGGGFWPKGSANQYMFNGGFQVSGIIAGSKSSVNPWGGDTTGAFFFDEKGTTVHGSALTALYNSARAIDAANWPGYARVPISDPGQELFDPALRGRISASEGDLWFLVWDGDPIRNAGRPHPLGVLAEVRLLGWNYPVGNDDIIYVMVTYYNITSANASAYAGYRTGLREKLLEAGQQFQQLNNSKFGINLPVGGYTIAPFLSGFAADPDVASAGANFASANIPFAMMYVWQANFGSAPAAWSFDPRLFGAPFFAGPGFVGMKFLRTGEGVPTITLFSQITGGGAFPAAANTTRLFRYQEGLVGPDLGVQCNYGLVTIAHICFVNTSSSADVRVTQSVPGVSLPPGASTTVVLAYVHAAPVALAGYTPGTNVPPGDPTRPANATLLATGANRIDSIAGYAGYQDANGDGVVQPREMATIPRSLYGKAQLAQAVFDAKFLLPSAPAAPDFFLIPGDSRVTVVWKPSATEITGDPFFQFAKDAATVPTGGGTAVPNPLYDPNFRKFDVEGYRVYRGRVDQPAALTLVAQFDYRGTAFDDYNGAVSVGSQCAPELGVTTSCAGVFDARVPGVARTRKRSYDIAGTVVQVRDGDRTTLSNGLLTTLAADTLGRSASQSLPALTNSGVPFVYHDTSVRNALTYYYAVTAFDYNSVQSGPSTMESPRSTRSVVPAVVAANYRSSVTLQPVRIEGRGVNQSAKFPAAPTLDAATGIFSGPQQPANGSVIAFVGGLAGDVVKVGGTIRARLDSIEMGQMDLSQCCGGGAPAIATNYYISLTADGATTKLKIPVTSRLEADVTTEALFEAVTLDAALVGRYGGAGEFKARGLFSLTMPQGPRTGAWMLGAALSQPNFGGVELPAGTLNYRYNGARWFDGPSITRNEITPDPINACGTGLTSSCTSTLSFANAGKLTGVTTVYQPMGYTMFNREWRNMESPLSTVRRAADYNIYWGAAGRVDSVIDVTHNVVVPFQANTINAGWGILNQNATNVAGYFDNRPGVLTPTDWICVEPFRSKISQPTNTFFSCTAPAATLRQTAVLGPIAFGAGDNQVSTGQSVRNPANIQAQPGFSLMVAGTVSMFEMTTLPAAGTVWALRDYAGGIIAGGNGVGGSGNSGPYKFVPGVRPFTAVGAEAVLEYVAENTLAPTTSASLALVHTVPDPYYVLRGEPDIPIRFIHLPAKATIRIYTSAGRLIRVLPHDSNTLGGETSWDLRTRENKQVSSGVFFYHVTAENGASTVGRMTVVRDVR